MRKITVNHGVYGCEHPCCGTEIQAVEIIDGEEYERHTLFEFEHFTPDEVKPHVEKYVAPNWPDWVGVPIEIGDLHCPTA
jgi:hypothetical protein